MVEERAALNVETFGPRWLAWLVVLGDYVSSIGKTDWEPVAPFEFY